MLSSAPKWIGNLLEGLVSPSLEAINISNISPSLKKIRFQGDISRMKFEIGYANVIRVSETEFRNYTVAYHDTKAGILEIIFHIHGNGVGSQFIATLKVGDQLRISIPRGKKQYEPKIKHQFIFGDETSLGLASSILPYLKKNKHQFQFYFELNDDNKHVPEFLGLENYQIFAKNGSFQKEEWIKQLPIFNTTEWLTGNFILTGNVKSIQKFRTVLKSKITSGKILTKGYWLEEKKGL